MIALIDTQRLRRLLCIGAHCDDIEIGAGGSIARLAAEVPGLDILWVVLCAADPVRAAEARRAATLFTGGAGRTRIELLGFRESFLPWQGEAAKLEFERLKGEFSPDLILTHHDDDRHQDHRLVAELTWNTWRDHTILGYEIPKWDGDLGRPNLYVPLAESLCRDKSRRIVDTFASQRQRAWFTEDVFMALMRLRGVECNSPTRHAEAFHARKLVM